MKRLAAPWFLALAVLAGTPVFISPILDKQKEAPVWSARPDGHGGRSGWAVVGSVSGGEGEGRDARLFDGRDWGGGLRIDQAPLRYWQQLLQVLCGPSGCSARQHRAALSARPCSQRS